MENLHPFAIIKYVKLVGKKKFTTIALNLGHETFIIYVALLASSDSSVHPSYKLQVAGLIPEKVPTIIPDMPVSRTRTIVIAITSFLLSNKLKKFYIIGRAKRFAKKQLIWMIQTTSKAFPITM